ncbi:MAG: hypothetical protein ABIN37_03740 [Burkholderiaceae bacterium]
MHTTLLTAYAVVAPFCAFFRRLSDEAAWRRASLRMRDSVAITLQPAVRRGRAVAPAQPLRAASVKRPLLRVVRVLETGQAPAHTGRLMISGRMADVCAELERMAEREAAMPGTR